MTAKGMPGVDFFPPPSQAKDKAKEPTKSAGTSLTIAQLEKQLRQTIETIGLVASGFDNFDGEIIIENAADIAKALRDVAEHNPKVRARLESLLAVGAWGAILTVIGAQVAMPIAVHHNLLPDSINTMLAEAGDIPIRGQEPKDNAD